MKSLFHKTFASYGTHFTVATQTPGLKGISRNKYSLSVVFCTVATQTPSLLPFKEEKTIASVIVVLERNFLYYIYILHSNNCYTKIKSNLGTWTMSDANKILTMENIQSFSVEDFLKLLKERTTLSVQLSEREILVVEVRQEELKPLPILEANVPSGWKQAIY
ncbi:MAG: hypothetical protein F6K24_01570 [Okeania sp. SIO2D1]|nr:hypothetical protein [Okeania sp. SIO2D1]